MPARQLSGAGDVFGRGARQGSGAGSVSAAAHGCWVLAEGAAAECGPPSASPRGSSASGSFSCGNSSLELEAPSVQPHPPQSRRSTLPELPSQVLASFAADSACIPSGEGGTTATSTTCAGPSEPARAAACSNVPVLQQILLESLQQ